MNTYKIMISYINENGSTQYHVMSDIDANNVSEAFMLSIDDFFDEHGTYEIRKVIVELQSNSLLANVSRRR